MALRGEDLDNEWNRLGDALFQEIEDLSLDQDQVTFLDLRPALVSALDGKAVPTYVLRPWRLVVLDALTLRGDVAVDRVSRRRGLQLTLDGVHLNSAGVDLVAGEISAALCERFPELLHRYCARSVLAHVRGQ